MRVAVVVYSPASRTYLVEISDETPNDQVLRAVEASDGVSWKHVEGWDEDPDWDGERDPVSIHSITEQGDVENQLWPEEEES